ncbi:MAG: PA14 domain-containing protein [Kiritimatiellia bacterium]
MKKYITLLASLLLAAACGCSRSEPAPEKPTKPPGKQARQPMAIPEDQEQPAPEKETASPEQPAGEKPARTAEAEDIQTGNLDSQLKEVLELEKEGWFSRALVKCRKLRSRFRKHPRVAQLDRTISRLNDRKRTALKLRYAMRNLAAEEIMKKRIAVEQMLEAGETGKILLRRVVREGSGEDVVEAVKLLGEHGKSPETASLLVDKLRGELDTSLTTVLTESIKEVSEHVEPEQFSSMCAHAVGRLKEDGAESVAPAVMELFSEMSSKLQDSVIPVIFSLVKGDRNHNFKKAAGVLAAVYKKRCDGEKEAFNSLAGSTDAYEYMNKYVEEAAVSENREIADWAVTEGIAFRPFLKGLRGSYYKGKNFDELILERLDTRIDLSKDRFPQGRSDVSMRWTGFVVIPKAGKYTFYSASDDGQKVWVNGKMLVDDWNHHGVTEKQGTIELEPGVYPYKVEFFQGGGGAAVKESWSGPGIEKQLLTAENLRSRPWEGWNADSVKKRKGEGN